MLTTIKKAVLAALSTCLTNFGRWATANDVHCELGYLLLFEAITEDFSVLQVDEALNALTGTRIVEKNNIEGNTVYRLRPGVETLLHDALEQEVRRNGNLCNNEDVVVFNAFFNDFETTSWSHGLYNSTCNIRREVSATTGNSARYWVGNIEFANEVSAQEVALFLKETQKGKKDSDLNDIYEQSVNLVLSYVKSKQK